MTARVQVHRARRLAAGLCARCGKVPPTQGRKACFPCRRADAARLALWRSERARESVAMSLAPDRSHGALMRKEGVTR